MYKQRLFSGDYLTQQPLRFETNPEVGSVNRSASILSWFFFGPTQKARDYSYLCFGTPIAFFMVVTAVAPISCPDHGPLSVALNPLGFPKRVKITPYKCGLIQQNQLN
jgi:hypothetical protein